MAETRKERNIRNETQRRIDAGDTSSYVQSQISSSPNTFTNVQPNQRQEQQQDIYKQAADTMKQAGITGVGDINKNKRDLANAGGFSDYVITDTTPKTEEKKQPLIDQFDNFMTSFGNKKFPILPTPLGFGIEALTSGLKGFDSTNRFFKNLNTKKSGSLSNQDKITLINLVKAGGEGSGLQYLEKWANDNDLNKEETRDLANKFTGEYSNIGSSIGSSGIIDYLTEGGKPEGFKDSVAAMFGQYDSGKIPGQAIGLDIEAQFKYDNLMKKYKETGNSEFLKNAQELVYTSSYPVDAMVDRPNLETVTDNLGTVGLEYLKATNPAAYDALRPAATSDQMKELAGKALTGDKNFDNKIFAAREAARERNNQGGGNAGISSLATAPTPFTDVNNNGILDNLEVAQATTPVTGVSSLTPTTIDYASMGPQYGGYVNQGISDPRFASYLQNLQMFPRRS